MSTSKNRPPLILSTAAVPETTHRYPKSDEPMGPARATPWSHWWDDAPARPQGSHDGSPDPLRETESRSK